MKKSLKYIGFVFIILLFSIFSLAGFSQSCISLTLISDTANIVKLQWTWTPFRLSYYGFSLYQWDDVLNSWQSIPINYNKTINVLNVYPDLSSSNTLQTWMHDPAIGLGKILVTSVTATNFNANPDNYLKNGSGEYIYDVIMFGSWDENNRKDLTPISSTAVRTFLNTGRGVLFGHDTQTSRMSIGGQINFGSLVDKTNLDIDITNERMYLWRGSINIKVVKDGFLLQYPHLIPHNLNLTVPFTHTTGQTAKGVVWMNFPDTVGAATQFRNPEQWVNRGTNNFYLTTWNNAGMIQTGHSNGQSSIDERKIIANTLWYLAQFTTDTIAEVRTAPDTRPPATPTVNSHNINCNQINILSCDSGTVYKFYVKATHITNINDTCNSNQLTVEHKTGLRGFFISEDNNPNGDPPIVRDASNNIITPLTLVAADSQWVTYTIQNPNHYIHVQAVDCAGNLSIVSTVKASDLQTTFIIYDTICPNNNYKKHGFTIYANELQTVGISKFYDTIPSVTGCDTIVILNLWVSKDTTQFDITICEGEIYQENGFNCSKAGIYMQDWKNRFGCDSVVILNLNVIDKDTVFIPATICEGEIYNKNGFISSKTGIYTQNFKNYFGCDSLVVLKLTVNPAPDIEIIAVTDNFCNEDFIELQIITNGDSFLWNTGDTENIIIITKSGTYFATTYLSDCKKTATYTVEECPCYVWLPNAFTPNSDELNEVFKPYISCYETMKNYKFFIYDRWGNIVFKSFDYAVGWDGTNGKGQEYASGIYACVIEYTNSKDKQTTKNGSVTVVR